MPEPLRMEGRERFASPPERIYAELTDLDALSKCIPDLVSAERDGDSRLRCVVRPGFSFLRGTLKLQIELADLVAAQSATMRVDATGIGLSMNCVSKFQLAANGPGTRLDWQTEVVKVAGLVATLSPALVRASAGQINQQAWQRIRARLGEGG